MTAPFDCPRCGVTLAMTDRQGVEIDYCPTCRGVWLDRGELDKLIERAGDMPPPTTAQPPSAWSAPGGAPSPYPPPQQSYDDRYYGGGHGSGHGGGHGGGHSSSQGRRRSWLRDMFD